MAAARDYYEILGVQRDAPVAAIRTAYLRLARERHPDRFSEPEAKRQAEEAFKTITTAFNTLTNERNRQEYDVPGIPILPVIGIKASL